jgi:hypothetical protein
MKITTGIVLALSALMPETVLAAEACSQYCVNQFNTSSNICNSSMVSAHDSAKAWYHQCIKNAQVQYQSCFAYRCYQTR